MGGRWEPELTGRGNSEQISACQIPNVELICNPGRERGEGSGAARAGPDPLSGRMMKGVYSPNFKEIKYQVGVAFRTSSPLPLFLLGHNWATLLQEEKGA